MRCDMKEVNFKVKLKLQIMDCIILGLLQLLFLIPSIYSLSYQVNAVVALLIVLSVLNIVGLTCNCYFSIKKNSKGPVFGYIFGTTCLIQGIVLCVSHGILLYGIVYSMFAVRVLMEANWFSNYFKEDLANKNTTDEQAK